ncbi:MULTISPECIES: hypothetical protein [Alteromonas]|jgi:uncharacterized protein (UPF0333 family)|uniref:Uncharacterized protein n=1 Tax=Alteromonas stellipolaris TaxID=233316 RepID=A0ABM5YJU7_9ALTE|nr:MULTISPECIES: hypothetical protein [Alteromonas]AMJ90871.1 hypothetical protein AV940_10540 [Alteromonas sp. Mac2]ALM90420.1 hypothetical protein AOR13_1379 [Alteromonas stellipolaris LMG 21856]AMJ74575.1 hypothetical protein AVL57_11750 [Alteromonas stellipolaris]AMJ87009.1 hypothetical protein AV939_10770 [Alteromonas sp. Mac1]AMJ94753.1 hypothetical protein AVL56_10905 [Alteromonas stellipolaris]
MNDENEQFRQAYQHSKRQRKVPSRIKRNVISNAKHHENSRTAKGVRFWQLLRGWHKDWFAFGAAAFVLVVLVGIYDFKSQVSNTANIDIIDVALEVHGFSDEIADVNINDYSKKYKAYSRAYEQQAATLNTVRTSVATLTNIDNQWTLVDCSSKQITLSDNLVASMREHQRIATGIEIGDQVALAFNQNGLILNITRSGAPRMC